MLCMPSSVIDRFVGDACNCPYSRIDVTALSGPSSSKFDATGFYCPLSKKFCKHIASFSLYNVHQESNGGSLSHIAGIRHCCSIAGSRTTSTGFVLEALNHYVHCVNNSSFRTTQLTKHAESTSKVTGWKLSEWMVFSERMVFSQMMSSDIFLKKKIAGIYGAQSQSRVTSVVPEDICATQVIGTSGFLQMQSNHLISTSELSEYTPHTGQIRNQPNPSLPCVEQLHFDEGSGRLVVCSSMSDGDLVCRRPSLRTPRVHLSPSDAVNQLSQASGENFHLCSDNNVLQGTSEVDEQFICPDNVRNGENKSSASEGFHCWDVKDQMLTSKYQFSDYHLNQELGTKVNPSEFCILDCPNDDKQVSEEIREERLHDLDSILTPTVPPSQLVSTNWMPCSRMSLDVQRSFRESILYLDNLGADYSKIFQYHPEAMSYTVQQLRALVCKLEHYGLKWTEQGRVFNMCPRILSLDPEDDLLLITNFLFQEVGLPPGHFSKVVKRCPRLLVAHVVKELRPTLWFLRHLGYKKLGHVVSNNPSLLSLSVKKKLRPTLRFVEGLGFSYKEGASMVVRFPAIFNYSIGENLQPKYNFLVHEMGGSNKDLLAFPQYFGYSLERRIKPRYDCLQKHGLSLSLQLMLRMSDVEFTVRYASSLAQDEECSSKELLVLSEMINAKLHERGPDSILAMQGLECLKPHVLLTVK